MSPSHPTLSSFDFADEILRRLANKKTFPNLTKIVVAGHSAGGQFATRHEMANRLHDSLGVSISYGVANPSSYAWPAAVRPLPTGDADPSTADSDVRRPPPRDRAAPFTSRTARRARHPRTAPAAE